MAGIERIHITTKMSGRGTYRFWDSLRRWNIANGIYREVFPTLLVGEEIIECTQDEFEAGYDHALGIDVKLHFENGMSATLQEKFLYTKYKTITVEYMQNPLTGEQGDWFNMQCQYYFVGYDREHLNCSLKNAHNAKRYNLTEEGRTGTCSICGQPMTFQDWILLYWPTIQHETIPWKLKENHYDGAKANFKYAEFDDIPSQCVVAKSPRF